MAENDPIRVSPDFATPFREILIHNLDVASSETDKIDALLSDGTITRDEFTREKLPGRGLKGMAPSFYPGLFAKLQEAASFFSQGDPHQIDSAEELGAFGAGLKTLLQSEVSVFGDQPLPVEALIAVLGPGADTTNSAADGFMTVGEAQRSILGTTIFSAEQLPKIARYLTTSHFGTHRGNAVTEWGRTALMFRRIRERWEGLTGRTGFFQSLTREGSCTDENAAIAYLPFSPRRVHETFRDFGSYEDWVPAFLKSDPLPGKPDIFDSEIEIPGPNLTYQVKTRNDSDGTSFGTYFEALPGGSFNVDFGKYFELPTRNGHTILIRRGAIDTASRPDSWACGAGREGWINTLAAGANRIVNPAWTKNREDEDKTNYGRHAYRDSDVIPLP